MNILLVCTGNTCRSPMAEGILKKLLPNHNISSAGVCTVNGLPASDNAIKATAEVNVDILSHKSRQITKEMAENSDLILCMTNNHKKMLAGVKCNTFTLGEFAGDKEEIPDPYGGNLDKYRACRDKLEKLIKIIAEKINDKNNTV